jgi:diguanylate cyclase (GGDEF)-like protein
MLPATPLLPYPDFATASREVVAFLDARMPLAVWNVTRAEGRLLIILQPSAGNAYGVKAGDSMIYADTMCARMVGGEAPNINIDIDAEPALREVPVRGTVPVNTYVGFPLRRSDGGVFGTLCGWDPLASSPLLREQRPLLELLSRLLTTILQFDLDREAAWRTDVQREASAMTDPLTGLGDARAFDRVCAHEEARCRDLGHRLTALRLDLDDLGTKHDRVTADARRHRVAQALREGLRADAHLAHLGGDRFAALLPGCGVAEATQAGERLREALAGAGVRAWIGCAERKPHRGLADALKKADEAIAADQAVREGRPPGRA